MMDEKAAEPTAAAPGGIVDAGPETSHSAGEGQEPVTTPDAASPAPATEGAADKRAKSPPVRSLVDLFTVKGANSAKLLRELEKTTSWQFEEADADAALAMLPEQDPHLARTRQLVYEAIEQHDGRFSRAAGNFAMRAAADDLVGLRLWPVSDETEPLAALAELAERVSPRLRHPKERRRAHNVLMIGVDLLSARRGLAFEAAAPVLRDAIGKPPEYSERRSNPRRHRVASVTLPRNDLDRVRDLLDLLHPWEQELDDARRAEGSARTEQDKALQEAAEACATVEQLRRDLAEAREELASARQEVAASRDQAKDVRIVASADVSELRGRTISFLNSRLRDLLATAKEAGEADPPRTPTAMRLLDQAIAEVRREVEWLRSSA